MIERGLTIIVPFYNTSEYILECLVSIHKYVPYAFVIVYNDGSDKDSTYILGKACEEASINYLLITSPINEGLPIALMRASCKVLTSHVMRVDADDYLRSSIDLDLSFDVTVRPHTAVSVTEFINNSYSNLSLLGIVIATDIFKTMYVNALEFSRYNTDIYEDLHHHIKLLSNGTRSYTCTTTKTDHYVYVKHRGTLAGTKFEATRRVLVVLSLLILKVLTIKDIK